MGWSRVFTLQGVWDQALECLTANDLLRRLVGLAAGETKGIRNSPPGARAPGNAGGSLDLSARFVGLRVQSCLPGEAGQDLFTSLPCPAGSDLLKSPPRWRHSQAAKAEDCKSFIPGSNPGAAFVGSGSKPASGLTPRRVKFPENGRGEVAEYGLRHTIANRAWGVKLHREFESLPLRQIACRAVSRPPSPSSTSDLASGTLASPWR